MPDVFSNLLVSCPNNGGLFLLYQGATYKLDSLDTTGFVVQGACMLRALQPARLARFQGGQQLAVTSGADFDDIHDVLLDGKFHYVVKTATNEIVKLDQQGREQQRWTLPGEIDSWHINCLARWNARLVFSAFGDFRSHKEYKAVSRGLGFVQDIATGEKLITDLSQPHSLLPVGDRLVLANSESFEIREYDPNGCLLRSKVLDGYTRGVLAHEGFLFVGLSKSRNVDSGGLAQAMVVALDAESWEELDRRPLPVDEIFSIQRIDDGAIVEGVAQLASHATRLLKERVHEGERDAIHLKEWAESIQRQAEGPSPEAVARDLLVRDRAAQIIDLENVNRENERKIYGLLETVHGKDVHIRNREEIIRGKDAEIQRRDEILRGRDEQLELLRRTMEESQDTLRDTRETLRRSLQRIGLLDDMVRQKESQLNQRQIELGASEIRVAALSEQIGKLNADISRLDDVSNICAKRIAELESSRSWRITRPIRAMKSYLMRRERVEAELPPDAEAPTGAALEVVGQQMIEVANVSDLPEVAPVVVEHRFDLRGASHPVTILTTPHCNHVAMEIATALERVGIPTETIFEVPQGGYRDEPHFVICPQFFERLPGLYVSFQMEQSVSSRWFTDSYVSMLENSFAILDYSIDNIAKLQELGLQPKQIYHVPVGHLDGYSELSEDRTYDCDVLFYGDIQNERRRTFIDELGRVCKVKVQNNLFGEALHAEMASARLIVNIHYYQGSLLETTRLWECVSLGHLVVSERSADMDCHPELQQLIDFVDVDDVSSMVQRVTHWLQNDDLRLQRIEQNKRLLKDLPNQFDYHFYRFLLATDNITFDDFWNLVGRKVKLPGDKLCLNLPEYVERSESFDRDNRFGFSRFIGLRHNKGWIGCAMSYKFIMRLARQEGRSILTICEDDVEFPPEFERRWNKIQKHLAASPSSWDAFSGLMANLHTEACVTRTHEDDGVRYVEADRLISMVFNVYGTKVFDIADTWDESDGDENSNTIDRYLERQDSLRVLTTTPFLVGHKEDLHSTLWGFQNTAYSNLIAESSALLEQKMNSHLGD